MAGKALPIIDMLPAGSAAIPPSVPTVKIQLDRMRVMCLDFNALAYVEMLTGENALKQEFWTDLSVTKLMTVMYAALRRDDASLTLTDVGAMLHPGNMEQVSDAVSTLYKVSSPEPDKDAPKGKDGQAVPTRASR